MRKKKLPPQFLVASGVAASAVVVAASAVVAAVGILGISTKKGTSEVFSPPGATAVRALQFLLPKKAYDEVFAQVVADTRDEYFAALAEGNNAKARWIRVRDSINMAVVFVQYLIAACLDRGMKIYKTFGSK